jgi:hypothetical protein
MDLLPEHARKVRRGGNRLGHQMDVGESGPGGRVDQDVESGTAPHDRVGEHHLAGPVTSDPVCLRSHPREHGRDQLRHSNLPLAQPDHAVVDATLGVGLKTGRVRDGRTLGVPAGQQRTLEA